jgi:RHS repeat-associated protein
MRKNQTFANEEHVVGGVPTIAGNEVIVSDYLGSTLNLGENGIESTAFGEGLETGFFTGKPFFEELESFVFKHRNYISNKAKWSTMDPSGFPDGSNSLAYVPDPLKQVDPLGTRAAQLYYLGDPVYLHFSSDNQVTLSGIVYTINYTGLFTMATGSGLKTMNLYAAAYANDPFWLIYDPVFGHIERQMHVNVSETNGKIYHSFQGNSAVDDDPVSMFINMTSSDPDNDPDGVEVLASAVSGKVAYDKRIISDISLESKAISCSFEDASGSVPFDLENYTWREN